MAGKKRPTTIEEYIAAAPSAGQAHLRRLYALLKRVAPDAQETIKWGTPFFVEPRFLFAFSAHKAHLNFSPMEVGLKPFRRELEKYQTTANFLQIPYDDSLSTLEGADRSAILEGKHHANLRGTQIVRGPRLAPGRSRGLEAVSVTRVL